MNEFYVVDNSGLSHQVLSEDYYWREGYVVFYIREGFWNVKCPVCEVFMPRFIKLINIPGSTNSSKG